MASNSMKIKPTDVKILRERSVSESKDGNCVLCCEKADYFAVGICDHPVCYKCSARMRAFSKQFYCAACRAEMNQVVFCQNLKKFQEFNLDSLPKKAQYKVSFENRTVKEAFETLIAHVCVVCGEKEQPFGSWQELKSHIRKVHEKQFCDICVGNLSLFTREFKLYTKKELVNHRKEGDKDERSHRGHPECKFCDDRYFDNDALLLHLRKTHFWCHFCEHDGKQDYYDMYKDLRKHFTTGHYLCDEGNCRNEKFTSVFRDKIDYQAHKLSVHGKKLNKLQTKEARKIDIDYNFRRRQQQQEVGVVNGSDYEDVRLRENKTYHGSEDVRQRENKTHRGSGQRYHRDHRGTLNFYDYEDVEKDRKTFHGKMRRHEAEEVDNRNVQRVGMAASASLSSSEPDIHNRLRDFHFNDSDDDVIGLSERLDKPSEPRKPRIEKAKEPGNRDQTPTEDLSAIMKEDTKPVESPPKDVVDAAAAPKKEDFPSLPGARPVELRSAKNKKEEEFPALGTSVKSKQPQAHRGGASAADAIKYSKDSTASDKTWTNHINGIPVKSSKKKGKGKSWSQQSGRTKATSTDDFPSLSSNTMNAGNESKSSKKHKNTSIVTSAKTKDASTVKPKNPPPGLRANTTAISVDTKKSLPPGLQRSDDSSGKMERNLRLLAMLQTYLDDFNLGIFKNMSGEFRRGLKTGEEYYKDIHDLLGDNLRYIFSELVALLPDEVKQQELLIARNNAKVLANKWEDVKRSAPTPSYTPPLAWGTSNGNDQTDVVMSRCVECGQTFPKDKTSEHMESHGESFPALPTGVKKKKNYNFEPMNNRYRSIKVENAWGK